MPRPRQSVPTRNSKVPFALKEMNVERHVESAPAPNPGTCTLLRRSSRTMEPPNRLISEMDTVGWLKV